MLLWNVEKLQKNLVFSRSTTHEKKRNQQITNLKN